MRHKGLGFLGEPNVREIARIVQKAEEIGFDSFWFSETRFTRDAISPLTAMALSTTKAKLGSAAINVYTRGVVLTAVTFATLDELSNGRMILGIGPGSPKILEKQGIGFVGALKRLREYVEAFRLLIRGDGPVNYKGEFVNVKDVALDFTPPRKEIPVYFAVTGPMALRMAGRIADGVILNGFTSVDYARQAIRRIKEGADSVGKRMEDFDIASANIMCVKEDGAAAKDSLKRLVATYLVTFPAIAKESGVSQDLLNSIKSAYEQDGLERASKLVPYSIVESLTVSGTPDECAARIREYEHAGVKRPIVMPISSNLDMVLETLSKV